MIRSASGAAGPSLIQVQGVRNPVPMATEVRRPTVLLLMAGPKFDLEWEFGARLTGLSRHCNGFLVTSSSAARELEIGAFRLYSTVHRAQNALAKCRGRIEYISRCQCWAVRLELEDERQRGFQAALRYRIVGLGDDTVLPFENRRRDANDPLIDRF